MFEERVSNKPVLKVERTMGTFNGYVKLLGGEWGSWFGYELLRKNGEEEGV